MRSYNEVWQCLYSHDGKGLPKFPVEDRVCISKAKKMYIAKWSEEIFTIRKIHPSNPHVPVDRRSRRGAGRNLLRTGPAEGVGADR